MAVLNRHLSWVAPIASAVILLSVSHRADASIMADAQLSSAADEELLAADLTTTASSSNAESGRRPKGSDNDEKDIAARCHLLGHGDNAGTSTSSSSSGGQTAGAVAVVTASA